MVQGPRQKYIGLHVSESVLSVVRKKYSSISPSRPLKRIKMREIWHRFSTPVAFEVLYF